MDSLKDSLNDHKKTVTLSAEQINFLMGINARFQAVLTQLQETVASEFLHYLAVHDFECDPNKDFHFEFHPEREHDNLIITERLKEK